MKKLTRDEMLRTVIDWKYKLRNSKTLTFKLVALRHQRITKLFLKRTVLKRGVLKGSTQLNE